MISPIITDGFGFAPHFIVTGGFGSGAAPVAPASLNRVFRVFSGGTADIFRTAANAGGAASIFRAGTGTIRPRMFRFPNAQDWDSVVDVDSLTNVDTLEN